MRKLEGERIVDLRQRIWSEPAGRPDPRDPMKTVRPGPDQVMAMIGTAVKVGRHEAMIFGLDAPSKSDGASPLSTSPRNWHARLAHGCRSLLPKRNAILRNRATICTEIRSWFAVPRPTRVPLGSYSPDG